MKKSFKLVSSLCAALLAVGAGVALSGANKSGEVKAEHDEVWSMIGTPDWSTDTDLSFDGVNKFFGGTHDRYSATYTFEKDDVFKIRKNHQWTYTVAYGENTSAGIGSYLQDDGTTDHNFKVKATGSYVISIKDDNVAGYGDKSYGFAIARPFNVVVKDGEETIKTHYYEDYKNEGYKFTVDASKYAKEHASFVGLFTDPELTVPFVSDTVITDQSKTLYAKYTRESGRYIVGKFGESNWDIEHAVLMPYNSEAGQFEGTISLEIGDEVKCAYWNGTELSSYYGFEAITSTAHALFCFNGADQSESPNIYCWARASYTFYFKDGGYGDANKKLSVAYNNDGTAEVLVAKLMSYGDSPVEGECGLRFPDCKAIFLSLPSDEQAVFQGYDVSEVTRFKNGYDRYVAWAQALGQKPWEEGSLSSSIFTLFGNNSEANTAIMVVVIISLVSLTAVGGFFFYRKRRHN